MKRYVVLALLVTWALIPALGFAPSPRMASAGAGKPKLISAKKCKKCHMKTYKSWAKTGHALAFELLKAGNPGQEKLKKKGDFTKDATCLKCHTTGYGEADGYPAVKAGAAFTEEEAAKAAKFEGVGCEVCHGKGSLFSPYKKKNKKTFKLSKIRELGAVSPPKKEQCEACHKGGDDSCPTIGADYKFDFKGSKKKDDKIHKHVKLKYDHGK